MGEEDGTTVKGILKDPCNDPSVSKTRTGFDSSVSLLAMHQGVEPWCAIYLRACTICQEMSPSKWNLATGLTRVESSMRRKLGERRQFLGSQWRRGEDSLSQGGSWHAAAAGWLKYWFAASPRCALVARLGQFSQHV